MLISAEAPDLHQSGPVLTPSPAYATPFRLWQEETGHGVLEAELCSRYCESGRIFWHRQMLSSEGALDFRVSTSPTINLASKSQGEETELHNDECQRR